MNDRVIYTSLVGGYDKLPQYDAIDSSFDYICFSNDYVDGEKIGQWTMKHIPYCSHDNVRLSRYVKILPHIVLSKYEYSLWIDSNILIYDKCIYEIIEKCIIEGCEWYGIKHPFRDCIYDEAKVCWQYGRVTYRDIQLQLDFLKAQNYPKHHGLYENNMILRRHNSHKIVSIDNEWWEIYNMYTRRDQLSLFYVFWKYNFKPKLLFDSENNTRNQYGVRNIVHPYSWYQNIILKIKQYRNFLEYYLNK